MLKLKAAAYGIDGNDPWGAIDPLGNKLVKDMIKMDGRQRNQLRPGSQVEIVLKKDQRTGKRTEGIVQNILTKSATHPRGIKVRLIDGQVGRVQKIITS